jgi:DUF1680 family protein
LALNLRQPEWWDRLSFKLNGEFIPTPPRSEQGYLRLDRECINGDAPELRMEMPEQRIEVHPHIRDCTGKVALQRGPLVTGFEALDNQPSARRWITYSL